MLAGMLTVLLAGIFGSIYGAIAGYVGGVLDNVMMRFSEMIQAFPTDYIGNCYLSSTWLQHVQYSACNDCCRMAELRTIDEECGAVRERK